jgi:hypothetical protein
VSLAWYYDAPKKVMRRRFRWWLADLIEKLALWIGDGVHGVQCEGDCYCKQSGRNHE